LPFKVVKTYYTGQDNQTGVNCVITQSAIAEDNLEFVTIVKEANLPLPSGRPAGQPIEVTYEYDINGTMQCSFKDVQTGQIIKIDIKPS
jgi:molecular chaperone DnaK (HSP70)